ncbi:MAG: hypothetical protein IPH59_10820 [bacterium]|nr:hypothetical protein [bacterium]
MDRICFVGKLANALSPGKSEELEKALATLVPESLPVDVAYEIVLQSYLFFGYAQAIESAKIFFGNLTKRGLKIPHSPDIAFDSASLRKRGEELCRSIYAPNFERLVANMAEVSPELSHWMVEEGYGKVLSRPGPTGMEREVASIVFLAISGHPVQLFSHVRGARNLGATREFLVSVVEEAGLKKPQKELIQGTIDKVFTF